MPMLASDCVRVTLDLPRDAHGFTVVHSLNIAEALQELPQPIGELDLPRLVAATIALLYKYTQQDDFDIGVIGATGASRVLNIVNASVESLASLEESIREVDQVENTAARLRGQGGSDVIVQAQVAVGAHNMVFDLASWPALEFSLTLVGSGCVSWRFRRDYFTGSFVERAQQHIVVLLTHAKEWASRPLMALSVLSEDERSTVLHVFNRTQVVKSDVPTVLAAVAASAEASTGSIAVDVGTQKMTYGELWAAAGKVAAAIQSAPAGEDSSGVVPIPILLDRGLLMVVSLLASWRSGGACMPLDNRTPQPRLKQMLQDAKARVAITLSSYREMFAWLPCTLVFADEVCANGGSTSSLQEPSMESSDLAYVLFTSGSTGVPKGVMLSHGALLAYIGWHIPYYGLCAEDAVPHLAGLSFDASMAEIWPTLCVGGRLLPAPNEDIRLQPEVLCRWFTETGITLTFLTTQLAETILLEPAYPEGLRLRILFTGGDKLHFGASEHAKFKLVNIYGPTECTVNATMCLVPPTSGPPPIGQPVVGTQIYVLDPQRRPQPVGIHGELYIGGPQVGIGYLARPDLTAEKFVENPFFGVEAPSGTCGSTLWPTGPQWEGRVGPSATTSTTMASKSLASAAAQHGRLLYRTGDLVHWTQDGTLHFLGRIDNQVKIRGQRIELGEIETKLLTHAAVKEVCVICCEVKAAGTVDKYLAAYWTPASPSAMVGEADGLESWLRDELPEYMVPKAFVKLDKLPLNQNGKVDRKSLPEPIFDQKREDDNASKKVPESEIEERIRDCFDTVLGRNCSSVDRSFFDLGGHSLSAGRLANLICRNLQCDLSIREIYDHPTVQNLAALLKGRDVNIPKTSCAPSDKYVDMQVLEASPVYSASFQQRALFEMAELGAEASQALNIVFVCQVRGPLDVLCLRRAFEALVLRHDALRSVFSVTSSGDALNEDLKDVTCEVKDCVGLDFEIVSKSPADLTEWILDQQYKTFDLRVGPLCRVRVLKEASGSWVLHWTLHHTAADLWSYNVLFQDLEDAYRFFAKDRNRVAMEWPIAAPQYRNLALDQTNWLRSEPGAKSFEYWMKKLDPAPPVLELPTDLRQAAGQRISFAGSRVDFVLPVALHDQLKGVAKRCAVSSVYPVLLAAWMVLLARHSQEEDVCVGVPMACRTSIEAERTVGYFVNPVCVRATVTGSFEAFINAVAADVKDVLQHQCVPLSEVCKQLGLSERKLLQAMLVYQTSPEERFASTLPSFFMGHAGSSFRFADDITFESFDLPQRHAQFDIALMLAPGPRGQLIGGFQYNTTSFSRAAIKELQGEYRRILEAVVKDSRQEVDAVQLMGEAEVQQTRRRADTPWPMELPSKTLPEVLLERARLQPIALALVGPDGTYTYGQLASRAEQVAYAILNSNLGDENGGEASSASAAGRPRLGEGQNPLVGIMVVPGFWMVGAPLGAWLAGRGYFPIDASHPIERIQQMVQDAEPQCIICQKDNHDVAEALGYSTIIVESIASQAAPSQRGAQGLLDGSALPRNGDRGFLVFTSGSTGKPKAVMLSFESLLCHAVFTAQHINMKRGQAVLQHTTWTFDAHICEIYPALLQGATVVVSKKDGSKDFKYLTNLINEQRVCHALFVPSLLAEILENTHMPRSVRSVITAGEATSVSLAARILEAPLTLHNYYGPSEGGIGATIYDIDSIKKMPPNSQSTPIGRPVTWHQVILLDAKLRPSVSRAGQMAILGEGLAIGYLKNPEETAKRFLPTPSYLREVLPNCGPRVYLTGDVGRYVQDDHLEFVGRLDNQVKLRGQRIELGEIEAVLLSLNVVTEAVAIVRGDRLLAYYSILHGVEEGSAADQCNERTRERLPRYMWPELVHISEWPRGRTGKVDRKALPLPQERQEVVIKPRTELEETLLHLFCQVLRRNVKGTSVTADFFALGGTSLRASTLLSLLRSQLPVAANLQFNELYAHPSAAGLASLFAHRREERRLGPAPAEGHLPASYGQEHMLTLQELRPKSGAYNSSLFLELKGQINRNALADAINLVVERHEVLRSNLARDLINDESIVVQVTTPRVEFRLNMEYWPAPSPLGMTSRESLRQLGRCNSKTLTRVYSPDASPRRQQRISRTGSLEDLQSHANQGSQGVTSSSVDPVPATTKSFKSFLGFGGRDQLSESSSVQPSSSNFRCITSDDPQPMASPCTLQRNVSAYLAYSSPAASPRTRPLAPSSSEVEADLEFFLDMDENCEHPMEQQGSDASNRNYQANISESGHRGTSRPRSQFPPEVAVVIGRLEDVAASSFDLRDEPLIRVVLASLNADLHILLICCHHAVTDGRSVNVFREELSEAYSAFCGGREPVLPRLPIQYADVSYWQRECMRNGQLEKELEYWRHQLEGLEPLNLPGDFTRPTVLNPDGAQVPIEVDANVMSRLRILVRAHGVTLFSALLSLFAVALGRHGGASDVAIASPVGNRDGVEVEQLIGYFVNTVIFRLKLEGSFDSLLKQAKQVVVGAFAHAQAPFASVLESAKLEPNAVPAMFALQDHDIGQWSMTGLEAKLVDLPRRVALFDVTLELWENKESGGIEGLFVYNTNIWSYERAARFVGSFCELMNSLVQEPSLELPLHSAAPKEEKRLMLSWGNHGRRPSPVPSCVEALQGALVRHWARPAIQFGSATMTYSQFGASVAALSDEIRAREPFKVASASNEEILVACLLERSFEMAIAIWATLCSGAAYVPIDPEYPSERVALILANSRPQLVLCREATRSMCDETPTLCVEKWPALGTVSRDKAEAVARQSAARFSRVEAGKLAYIIYTSGTTGKPKGVAVEHRAVANMVHEQCCLMRVTYTDRVFQFFKPAFDGAVQEYLSTAAAGASLILWKPSESFAEVMRGMRVTIATLTPSALSVLEIDRLPDLMQIGTAAEACPPALVKSWTMMGRRVVNAYGPSESCVVSTYAELEHGDTAPIGRPLVGVTCYVCEASRCRSLQPIGVPGELCIGGVQLARGYYGDTAKTEEKFIANHLDGSRMYRSGDLVQWNPAGQLIYIGRNDEMVKVRGFRVELTEVEAALGALGAMSVSVALNKNKDGLWAWCTLSPDTTLPKLKEGVAKILPQYMVPARIFPVDSLPLTANGKIDKLKLMVMASESAGVGKDKDEDYVAPSTSLESTVCKIASLVLHKEKLSVAEELGNAGMSSLKQVLLSQKLRDVGLDVPLVMLYDLKTVQAIANWLQNERAPESFVVDVDGSDGNRSRAENCICHSSERRRCAACLNGCVTSILRLMFRIVSWCWICGCVIWPAFIPLWLSSNVILPTFGIGATAAYLVVVAYPLYINSVALMVICTKWVVIGRYRAMVIPTNSFMFLRWWMVDRLCSFTSDTIMSPIRGGPLYFYYLRCLGLRATGYSRVDTQYISEFDLITIGRRCAIAEGAKLRPGVLEAGQLHLKGISFGDDCAIGENSVCTAGAVAGAGVTLQPLCMFSGRTARTLPDGSVWKGAPLVQSRQEPIRLPHGIFRNDLGKISLGMVLSMCLMVSCSGAGYLVFGLLSQAQGFAYLDQNKECALWQWRTTPEGWLFTAVWLMYGPPVMASADILLGYDFGRYANEVFGCLGGPYWLFGLRVVGMIVISFAAYGWALTILSAVMCRFLRGSRGRNSAMYQVRRVVLRMTFPRYPAQLSGTGGMALYLNLLGGSVSFSSTVSFADPPLEPRKLSIAAGAMLINARALGECIIRKGGFVGAGAVLLPHAEVEADAMVGGNTVAGRPVRTGLTLVSNPGVIVRRPTLSRPPRPTPWACLAGRWLLHFWYPILAPMLTQTVLLVTLLPAMYVATMVLNRFLAQGGFLLLLLALSPIYILLGLGLAVVAIGMKWILLGRFDASCTWRWTGSFYLSMLSFVQGLVGMTHAVFMGMTMGSPVYNSFLNLLGAHVEKDAILLSPIMEFENVSIGHEVVVDRDAMVSGQRLLPAMGGPSSFGTCFAKVKIGARSTISVSAVVVAAETAELTVLAPLSALGPSTKLPARTLAIGSPPQKFTWSKDRDNLVKPSVRPVPAELSRRVFLPQYVRRALGRMKVRSESAEMGSDGADQQTALVTGAGGYLGRHIVGALLEGTQLRVVCLVRASDQSGAQERVEASLRKAGVLTSKYGDRVQVVRGDLSQRQFGMSLSEFQHLSGHVTHVINSAAKVNLAEPFESMRKDNMEATAHVIEFCCIGRQKQLHHISTMGVLTPDMLSRSGTVLEATPLGDMRTMPLYGTGDQANGYPYTKWCAERMVFEAGNEHGLQVFVHRAGLIGGDSRTGALAEDVFFHFLSDCVKLRELPDMEGDKFNITPVDWVAKAIVRVATCPAYEKFAGTAVHPAARSNTVSMKDLELELSAAGYRPLKWMDFWEWRTKIVADPENFKSWSFCAALAVEGNGIDSMATSDLGFRAMREAVGEEVMHFEPRVHLRRMIAWCQGAGLLPRPSPERSTLEVSPGGMSPLGLRSAAVPLLRGIGGGREDSV